MDILYQYEYQQGSGSTALDTLHFLAASSPRGVLCRIRRSADNVMFVHPETTMSQLCCCDEYVSDLRYCEVDAMMRLCGYQLLTLDALLAQYEGTTPLVLHFRSFRPDAGVVSRIVADGRLSFATDSAEQLTTIAQAFPHHRVVGFACHLPTAEAMAMAGASAICMYGREVARFHAMNFTEVRAHSELWYERLRVSEYTHEEAFHQASQAGFDAMLMSPVYAKKQGQWR